MRITFPSVLILIAIALLPACRKRETSAESGHASPAPAARETKRKIVAAPALPPAKGAQLYVQHCAACHMADGSGVPNMQPALDESAIASGDPALLIAVLLKGPAAVLPADRPKFTNAMPPFGPQLKDPEIAAILTHVRKQFAAGATPIAPIDVATVRAGK